MNCLLFGIINPDNIKFSLLVLSDQKLKVLALANPGV